MPATIHIAVIEPAEELNTRQRRVPTCLRLRIRMLSLLAAGTTAAGVLCARLSISAATLKEWKSNYAQGGVQALLHEGRGGDKRSGICGDQKQKIERKLSDPKNDFRSYGRSAGSGSKRNRASTKSTMA